MSTPGNNQILGIEDCRALAFDNGRRLSLNPEQISSIRKFGQFKVSNGQMTQVWETAKWFQYGTKNLCDLYLTRMKNVWNIFSDDIPRLIVGNLMPDKKAFDFSIKDGIKYILDGTYDLLDLIVGVPHRAITQTVATPPNTLISNEEKIAINNNNNNDNRKEVVKIIGYGEKRINYKWTFLGREKDPDVSVSIPLSYPFWRWYNFIIRGAALTWNTAYGLIKKNLIDGALFFTPGGIWKRDCLGVKLFVSNFRSLCATCINSRKTYLASNKDEGMLGGTISNILNWIYSYIIRMPVCVVILCICHTFGFLFGLALTTLNTALSIALAVSSPVWVGVGCNILYQLSEYLIYDAVQGWFPLLRIILLNWLTAGLLNIIVSVLTIVFGIVFAIFYMIYTNLAAVTKYTWDLLMFGLIRCLAKVPISDNFVCYKIIPGAWKGNVIGAGVVDNHDSASTSEDTTIIDGSLNV